MKFALDYLPVFVLAFIRFSVASLVLFPFVINKLKVQKKDIPMIIVAGLAGISIHIALFFYGLKSTSAINAGVLFASGPLFTIAIALIFLRERITKKMLLGCIIGFIGILTVVIADTNEALQISPIGDLLVLGSTLSFVVFEIVSKKLFKTYSPYTVTFYAFLIGAITFLPFALPYFVHNTQNLLLTLSPMAIFAVMFGIFGSSLTAYLFWQKGLEKIDASKAGFFLYLDPIFATVASVIILGEIITVYFVLGSILIFLGILIAHNQIPRFGNFFMRVREKKLSA